MKRSMMIGLGAAGLGVGGAAGAQVPLDRADPNVVGRIVPGNDPAPPLPDATATPVAPPPPAAAAASGVVTGTVRAIVVEGQDRLPPETFAAALAPRIGRELSRADLSDLAGAVAGAARDRGYPFATAAVPAQALAGGVLRVVLDLGRIDAVRVVGAQSSAAADRLLARALVGRGAPARRGDVERAILLVGELPGVRVTGSRYVRQDGFGILLVTIEQDRFALYAQLDNRGSDEVGPARSTLVASLRDLAPGGGDELAVIASQTPFQLREFAFLRARYAAPVGASGTVVSASASAARSRPGGSLRALDVVGESADAAAAVQHPLLRSRGRSLSAGLEFRTLGTDQRIAGRALRRDRLATLSGTLDGAVASLAGGGLRGGLVLTAGLPLDGTTREGSPMASRPDGDARFVSAGYVLDWARKIAGPVSVAVASAGQVASRPLLASAEFGVGGPAFGRAYEFSERTGDGGVAGSVELRADAGSIPGSVVTRSQFYGFADGGYAYNLRDGFGGGRIFSAGAGARVGTGRLDWLVEVAVPLNADRFDTGDRSPRLSLRVARAF